MPSSVSFIKDDSNEKARQTGITGLDYNKLKSSEEMDKEISELKKELVKEKERTKKAIAEKEKLEKEYEKELIFQKKKEWLYPQWKLLRGQIDIIRL